MTRYTEHFQAQTVPQSQPLPDSGQVKNSAGGFSFEVDSWTQLDRFLILGTEGGSYYSTEKALTKDAGKAVEICLKEDGVRVVERIVEISDGGRAIKNDPAIFALALAAKKGDLPTRKAAYAALPKVCRIGTHLFQFVETLETFGGWSRGAREAVASWYLSMPVEKLAYQVTKYQQRNGWSHRDLLRLCHAKANSPDRAALFRWIISGIDGLGERKVQRKVAGGTQEVVYSALPTDLLPKAIWSFEAAKKAPNVKEVAELIKTSKLPRECVPTQFLKDAEIWEALLEEMPLTALIRNLGNMSKAGFLKPLSSAARTVLDRVTDQEYLHRSRIHPVSILAALLTYKSGRGNRGSGTWTPVGTVVDALDSAFYLAFKNVEPTGKRIMLALDVSGSMGGPELNGIAGLTPRVGAAAMALVTANVEKNHMFTAFTSSGWSGGSRGPWGNNGIQVLDISPSMRLETVIEKTSHLPFGGTDCALPMLYASQNKLNVDTFVVLTDSETWAGGVHPTVALKAYRNKTQIPAKLAVVAMVPNKFSIADPNDSGMMDVVGFDTATPQVISEFSRWENSRAARQGR